MPSHVQLVNRAAVLGCVACLLSLAAASAASAAAVSGPDAKVDSHLLQLVGTAQRNTNAVTATKGEDNGLTVDSRERVLVDVYVKGRAGEATEALRSAGMEVDTATNRAPVPMVEGWLPASAVDAVAKLDVVRGVIAVMGSGSDTGGTLSQGDASHNGPAARTVGPPGYPSPTGKDVDVGIISTSMSRMGGGAADSQATGDLPSNVQILKEGPTGGSDEGRAMAELMYDMAPGINHFMFATGDGTVGAAGKANSIDQLTFAGADVIADDTFFLAEPFFQDGVIAQAVDNAKAHGIGYFASAGNMGDQSWEGTYRPSTVTSGFNNFDTTGGNDTTQKIRHVGPGGFIAVFLQWAEPWGRASTDIDLFLDDATTGNVLAQDITGISSGIPLANVFWRNNTTSSVTVQIRIKRYSGTAQPIMKWIANSDTAFVTNEWDTRSGTVNPDAASATGAIAVGAVPYNRSGLNTPELFSSRGQPFKLFDKNGNAIARDTRLAPRLAAADGISTSVPGFNPFFGTSAAAPAAAAVATLVKSARPSMTVNELWDIMSNPSNSIDCIITPGYPDRDCGYGFILADRAVRDALTPRVTSFSPPFPSGDVYPNAKMVFSFNQRMDHASTQSAFSLSKTGGGQAVPGSFVWFGEQALVFTPSADLQSGAQYTLTMNKTALSTALIGMKQPSSSSFTTTNRPVLETVTPAANATGVARNTQVVVTFSKAMDKASTAAAFTLRRDGTSTNVAGSVTWFGDRALVFKPSAQLAGSVRYRVSVAGTAKDTAANTLINPTSSVFTTKP